MPQMKFRGECHQRFDPPEKEVSARRQPAVERGDDRTLGGLLQVDQDVPAEDHVEDGKGSDAGGLDQVDPAEGDPAADLLFDPVAARALGVEEAGLSLFRGLAERILPEDPRPGARDRTRGYVAAEDLDGAPIEEVLLRQQNRERVRLLPRRAPGAPEAQRLSRRSLPVPLGKKLLAEGFQLLRLAEEVGLRIRDVIDQSVHLGVAGRRVPQTMKVRTGAVEPQLLHPPSHARLEQEAVRLVEIDAALLPDDVREDSEDVFRERAHAVVRHGPASLLRISARIAARRDSESRHAASSSRPKRRRRRWRASETSSAIDSRASASTSTGMSSASASVSSAVRAARATRSSGSSSNRLRRIGRRSESPRRPIASSAVARSRQSGSPARRSISVAAAGSESSAAEA